MFEVINSALGVDMAASLSEAAQRYEQQKSPRYRVRIICYEPDSVGIMDTLEQHWLKDDHGATWSTGDVYEAEWLANSLNDVHAFRPRVLAGVTG